MKAAEGERRAYRHGERIVEDQLAPSPQYLCALSRVEKASRPYLKAARNINEMRGGLRSSAPVIGHAAV